MSSPVAAIDVVASDDGASELLGQEIQLIGGFGATEDSKTLGPFPLDCILKALGSPVQRFLPTCRSEGSVLPNHRGCQSSVPIVLHRELLQNHSGTMKRV
jgi:hypothetical protein